MIYHLTRRAYLLSFDEDKDPGKEVIDKYAEAIEIWEVHQILNSGDEEMEKIIKSN